MNKFMFYNRDLGECYFVIASFLEDAWNEIADCLGCEYTACNIECVGVF